MARTGLEKADVKRARDSLVAQSQYPSVDAVRIALGNTGSKSTIHKYLKELEEEQGGASRQNAISDALQDLVARLAARLHEEADNRIAAMALEHEEGKAQLEAELAQARAEAAGHAQTRAQLQAETLARHKAEQQVDHLTERREHVQAELRKAQQALALKQEELARANQEAAKAAAELAHARVAAYDAQRLAREQEARLAQMREMELELARTRAAADGQAGLVAELRSMLQGGHAPAAKAAHKSSRKSG